VLAIALLGLYPNHLALVEMDQEIEEMNLGIEEQQTLSPVLNRLIQKAKPAETMGLPIPGKQTAMRLDVDAITGLLQAMVDETKLKIHQVTPDESSLSEESPYLIMNLIVQGDFFNFRSLLVELGKMTFLEDIDDFEIGVADDGKQMKLKLVFVQEK
jgi:hypothetical protein